MCNRCNSNASYSNSSCGCNFCCNSCCGNGWGNFWNSNFQSICRDCCGNIHVSNNGCNSCGCNSCSSNNGYGCSDTSSSVYVFTGCNRTSNATATSNGSDYYAQQYGLTSTSGCSGTTFGSCGSARRRSRSGCGYGCGCGYGYGYGYDSDNND